LPSACLSQFTDDLAHGVQAGGFDGAVELLLEDGSGLRGAGSVGGGFAEALQSALDGFALGFGELVLLVGGHDAVLDGGQAEGAAAVAVIQSDGTFLAFGQVVADVDGAREGGDSEFVLLDKGDVGVVALSCGKATDDGRSGLGFACEANIRRAW